MIRLRTWYAASRPGYSRPHFWFYAVRIAEDPWGIGTYRWDLHNTDPDLPWRGEYEKVSDRIHRITVNQPLGNIDEYELRPLDDCWIAHESDAFRARPIRNPAGEKIREHPSLEWVIGWLDYTHGKRIAWREKQFERMESRRQHLTDAMLEALIGECSRHDFRLPTKTAILAEPEGVMLDPPWVITYSFKESDGEHLLSVRISNRFTNDREFSIDRNGNVNHL